MATVTEKLDAYDRIVEIAIDNGEAFMATLRYMDRNLFQFDSEDRAAFRIVMDEMTKLEIDVL
jgi:hypothetical protein